MDVTIVTREDQFAQAMSIRQRVFVEEQACPVDEEFDEYDALGACLHLLGTCQGNAVATARLIPYGDDKGCKFQRIAIDRAYRKHGYGRILLAKLGEVALQQGYTHVTIHAQLQAKGFYEGCGFHATDDTTFMEAGIVHLHMEKDLGE